MPTYDYHCKKCDYTFEEFQPMTADVLTVCPKCGQASLRRLFGVGAGMVFKGSGFYLTDYKNSGSNSPSTKESTPATKPESKSADSSSPPPKPSTDKKK
ncbi:MAG: zinc ribbon domain-containing protein [Ignavibacteriales bacterium]|nr:zinc ribbon domain-containing protein [Ignavibacteriales bacterium]